MPTFRRVTPSEASDEVARTFDEIKRVLKVDFVPQFFQTLANAPNVLVGTWTVYRNVNWHGQLPPALKEVVFTAIAAARNCHYCEAAHLAFCKVLGVDTPNLRAVIKDVDAVQPERLRDVVKFDVECAHQPVSITSEKCDVLRRHGFSDAEIIELLAMVSFSLYAINLADAMKLDIDDDFTQILGGSVQTAIE